MPQAILMTEDEKLSGFRVMLRNATSAVFLGGAGVSTESRHPGLSQQGRPVSQDGKALRPLSAGVSSVLRMSAQRA